MSVEQKVSSHKRRTRAEVQELVAEFVRSGMRRSEFCRSRRLSFGTLNRHLKEQRWKTKSPAASSAGPLVPVELAARKSPTQRESDPHRQPTGRTEVCSDTLGRGKLPSAASPCARLLFHDSPPACRSPDPLPSRPYSRYMGRPAFIDSSDRGISVK
jgi:hypothetical protein